MKFLEKLRGKLHLLIFLLALAIDLILFDSRFFKYIVLAYFIMFASTLVTCYVKVWLSNVKLYLGIVRIFKKMKVLEQEIVVGRVSDRNVAIEALENAARSVLAAKEVAASYRMLRSVGVRRAFELCQIIEEVQKSGYAS